ncbi:hypothetical protein GTO89_11290 [Heliobacterium gestii]|uniref:Putative Flp pilus-assembly TadG-like N-terminal domain-containing protein n=1 Tax=Heliomicrobium gestii TaxID=2699 RepID=A0A845LGS5_HELGE|nr:pilus assembly protein TadG-related protein [Heliomicrobium gestii]MBM7867359.1 cytoskeletal protein CcmA (bactofilin family) [Heliomicrobium gestii]MZP43625.1 hypothetical protein [Heliomicrobium gestii]
MRDHNRRNSDQKGAIVIFFALLLPVLIGFLGLAIDLSWLYLNKQKAQAAVDFAALSAAQKVVENPAAASAAATTMAAKNGLDPVNFRIEQDEHGIANIVRLEASKGVDLFFLPLFGYREWALHVTAAAKAYDRAAPVFRYTIFAGSDTSALSLSGNGNTINGKVRANGGLDITGTGNQFTDVVEYGGALSGMSGNSFTRLPLLMSPAPFSLPGWAELRDGAVQSYASGLVITEMNLNGILYVDGDVTVESASLSGSGVIAASGDIRITGTGARYNGAGSRAAYYSRKNIFVSGDGLQVDGVLCAPAGSIIVSGSTNRLVGALTASTITLNTSQSLFFYDASAVGLLTGKGAQLLK